MESLMKGFPHLHKNSGLIRGKEVCVCVCVHACVHAWEVKWVKNDEKLKCQLLSRACTIRQCKNHMIS